MYNEVCYDKSFLKKVIIRLDFTSAIDALQKAVPAKLVKSIIASFPIVEPTEQVGHEFMFEADGVTSRQVANKQWNYFGKDRLQKLTVAARNVIFEYDSYVSYEKTKEQLVSIIDAFAKQYPDTQISRFGIRYINQIEIEVADSTKWNDFIVPELLGNRDFFENDQITRMVAISELKYDDIDVRFQYGMPNPDYPAVIKRPLYVLDLDAYYSQAFEVIEVAGIMDKAHARIQNLFERSITKALREKMNVRPVQE